MINTKTKGELGNKIEYDVEHDLFHPQNVYSEEYITPTFIEYVQKLENINAKLEQQIEKMRCCANCLKYDRNNRVCSRTKFVVIETLCNCSDSWELRR